MSGIDHLRAMARLAVRGMRARGADAASPAPRRRVAVEKSGVRVDGARVLRYLAATDGGGIEAFRGPDAIVPALFGATWAATGALELLALLDAPLPLGGVVHLEEEVLPIRPLRAGDTVRFRLELDGAEPVRGGTRLTLVSRTWNAAGVLCSQSTSVMLARSRRPEPRAPSETMHRGKGAAPSEPHVQWGEIARWTLPGGEGRRYARASGDYNPIHLWGLTARAFGFRRPILHGYATAARVSHALIRRHFGGDPCALRRLRIAFRAPLLLPARVRLLTGEHDGHGHFRVVDEAGDRVYAEGSFNATHAPRDERTGSLPSTRDGT
ncbi:MAG: MaoC-like dehydratase [Gemmatimonadetes bacterium]|nr:MaoC-like dehydratase [Gemmatimonadota bacterium]